jgi:hypothetical protein
MTPSVTRRLAGALLLWLAVVPGVLAASPAGGGFGASGGSVPTVDDPLPPAGDSHFFE